MESKPSDFALLESKPSDFALLESNALALGGLTKLKRWTPILTLNSHSW
ncbi:hypothetical protein QUF54_03270 [Candidatus Marithioploca araucensis]|uniref:Uncharacterized protein n=1 Tax=Candidatus Marithioploca araucensis TaxID=70273 RepID=A0ABT7VRQ8_9GAMM|nr:hypothetical protein [Candidatus Marithioploca araucensis]